MSDPQLIGPGLASTPAEAGKPARHVRALPYDLLKEAANRLGIMSLLGATLWVLATTLDELVIRATMRRPRDLCPDAIDICDCRGERAGLTCSLLLYATGQSGS